MKRGVANFRGLLPIIGNTKLPDGYASIALNTKLVSGDIEGFFDIGNPFQLAKPPSIWTLAQAANDAWLQFNEAELASFAFDIVCIPGIIAADPTGRRYIAGYNALTYGPTGVFQGPSTETSVPQFTNTYYATDASQRGTAAVGAYPYKTFPLGVPNPTVAPSVVVGTVAGLSVDYEFSQESSLNNAILNAAGTGYSVGDILTVVGGTLSNSLPAATIQVTQVGPGGVIQEFVLLTGGFYQAGLGPPATGASVTGGTGTGATFDTTSVPNSFNGFTPFSPGNGGDFYTQWTIAGNKWRCVAGQGGLRICFSNGAFDLKGCTEYSAQMDAAVFDNGSGEFPQLALYLSGQNTGNAVGNVFTGPAVILTKGGDFALCSDVHDDNGDSLLADGTVIVDQQSGLSIANATFYRIKATMKAQTASSTPGYSVTATVATQAAPGTIIATLTGFIPYLGESIAVAMNHTHTGDSDRHEETAEFENVLISVTEPVSGLSEEFTNYVYTFDQQIPLDVLSQESGPSDPSPTISVTINSSVNPATRATVAVTIPAVPSGDFINYINLYRLVLDASGNEVYTLVTVLTALNMTSVSASFTPGQPVTGADSETTATVLSYSSGLLILYDVQGLFQIGEEIIQSSSVHGIYSSVALSSTSITYDDSAQDSAIGPDVLISQTWLPPPPTLQGLIALPNGIMAGFYDNVLCLSAQGYPHAWPLENQYSIDTTIKCIQAIDTTILIVDQANPYTAWGTDPGAFAMSKEVSNQGCTATRGTVTHKRFGVIFPSGNGIAFYRGQGQLDLVRVGPSGQPPFSYEQWTKLDPTSFKAVLHDDLYWFWFDNGTTKGCYVLDLADTGFGMVNMDVHVTTAYVDRVSDTMYLVPDFSIFPVNGDTVSTALNVVSQWEYAATMRPRQWGKNEWLMNRPAAMQRARVRYTTASSADSINLTVSSEQGTIYDGPVTTDSMFVMGNVEPGIRLNGLLTMTGEVVVNTLELAETATDMLEGAET